MGFFSSSQTTTQSSDAAELSLKGSEYEDLYNQVMIEAAEILGFDIQSQRVEEYADPAAARAAEARVSELRSTIERADAEIARINSSTNPNQYDLLRAQGDKRNAERQLTRQLDDLANMERETYTDFTVTKLEDIRVRDAIDRYGEDSREVQQMRETVKAEEVFKAETKSEVTNNFLTNLKKYTSGDFSFTPEQEAQIDKYINPIKNVLNRTTTDLLNKYGDDYDLLTQELDKIGEQINQTNFDTFSALEAAQVQIERSGETLTSVLENVNRSSEAKAQFQFDLLSEQADRAVDNQNAMLGLPPNSQMAFIQKAKIKNDIMKSLQLDLAEQTAKGTMAIQSNVEEGKKNISLQKVLLASKTGEKKENLAKAGADLLSTYLGKEEEAISKKGEALVGLEKTKSEQLYNAAFGNIPSMLQAGEGGLNFFGKEKAQDVALASGVGSMVTGQLGFEKNKQLYEGETTSTTTQSPSFFDAFTDVASTAAGAYGLGMDLGWWGK